MQPVTVSVTVERPRDEVYAFLEVLGNHEPFTNHFLLDWSLDGPAGGVGARARMRGRAPGGQSEWMDMEVVEAVAPERIVARAVSGGGTRRTRGTYRLIALGEHRTKVEFELVYEAAPAGDRMLAPVVRAWLRKVNGRAMERLGEQLASDRVPAAA
jgi:uncharacterized protein YndB with AHSA1/START domain